MTFTEKPFLYFIFAVYFGWLFIRNREQWVVWFLLFASLGFYGHEHWELLPLLLVYCFVNWFIGRKIPCSNRPRLLLGIGVGFNLVVLGYFKYFPLLANLYFELTGNPDLYLNPEHWQVPYGISFFAFTGIAYMVDVYRREHVAIESFSRYSLSATFFPHLVAGPILRPNEFLNQLEPGQLPRQSFLPIEATYLIARGFFKKMVLADRIAEAIDPFFAHVMDTTTSGVWALPYVYLYALQIYFDFSAYTDIARGLAQLFGYRWPENFNLPYLATSVADFWHRWHISLSRFLKDYLYIPLGGNRGGWWRTNRNLMLTMMLGGLWHGANWSFLIWGTLHGLYLVIHRFWQLMPLRNQLQKLVGIPAAFWKAISILITFHAVCLAWCFFRLTRWTESVECISKVFSFDFSNGFVGGAYDASLWGAILGYGFLIFIANWLHPSMVKPRWNLLTGLSLGYCIAMLVLALLVSPSTTAGGFIYFQF